MFPSSQNDSVGVLIRDGKDASRGQVLAAPGSIRNATRFTARTYLLTTAEGGRAMPLHSGGRPQFYFRTLDVTGKLNLVGDDWAMPGSHVMIDVELVAPVALEQGLRFALRENGRTIGAGTVVEIKD